MQPSLTLGFGESGVAFNVWGSAFGMDRSAPESTDQVDELDFTLSYDTSLGEDGKVGLSLGFIEYTFPSLDAGTKHSEEAYGSLSFDNTIAVSKRLQAATSVSSVTMLSFSRPNARSLICRTRSREIWNLRPTFSSDSGSSVPRP